MSVVEKILLETSLGLVSLLCPASSLQMQVLAALTPPQRTSGRIIVEPYPSRLPPLISSLLNGLGVFCDDLMFLGIRVPDTESHLDFTPGLCGFSSNFLMKKKEHEHKQVERFFS